MRLALAILLLILSGCRFDAANSGIAVTGVSGWSQGERGYFADIGLEYRLSDIVIEALDNGVPLVFIVNLRIKPLDAPLWNGTVTQDFGFRVRYRPLSTLYEVERLGGEPEVPERFVSREALFAYLGELDEIRVAEAMELETGEDYEIAVRARLDIGSLPLPIRPMAYLSPSWNQDSGWSQWPLTL